MTNPAFDFLRKYKECDEHTEALVMKKSLGRITSSEMLTAFEKGISGEYGKVYKIEPQVLLDWIFKYLSGKTSVKNYLESGLLNPHTGPTNINYYCNPRDWMKEVNKCYNAFISGVKEDNFHPDCFSVLVIDNKINYKLTRYGKYENEKYGDLTAMEAMQRGLKDFFLDCKSKGYNQIYFL